MNPSEVQQLFKKYIWCSNRVSCMCTECSCVTLEVKGRCLWQESVFSLLSPSLITAVLAADAQ